MSADPLPPAGPRAGEAEYTEFIRDIADDAQLLVSDLLTEVYRSRISPAAVQERSDQLRRLMGDMAYGTFGLGRSQGQNLAQLAPLYKLSSERLRKKFNLAAALHHLKNRERPSRPAPAHRATLDRAPTSAPQRLARALTVLQRESGLTHEQLAAELGKSRSYVSRLLSGERKASWLHVRDLAEACGVPRDSLRPLAEVALGIASDGQEPGAYFRAYLNALRLAAGRPTNAELRSAGGNTLRVSDIQHAFTGPGVPDWTTMQLLALALSSDPADLRPLWRSALDSHTTAHDSHFPADAFG